MLQMQDINCFSKGIQCLKKVGDSISMHFEEA